MRCKWGRHMDPELIAFACDSSAKIQPAARSSEQLLRSRGWELKKETWVKTVEHGGLNAVACVAASEADALLAAGAPVLLRRLDKAERLARASLYTWGVALH